jgi:hypothetical protein
VRLDEGAMHAHPWGVSDNAEFNDGAAIGQRVNP